MHANRRVSGVVQLWALNQMGNETILQTAVRFIIQNVRLYLFGHFTDYPKIIYPPTANQVIQITRKQLFGSLVHPGRNSNDVFNLSIDTLREIAADAIHTDGFLPA